MRIAFLVDRPNQYRLFGPVIDQALARGWHVECWHDERRPGHFQKSSAGTMTEQPPRFAHGRPEVQPYAASAVLDDRLGGPTDAIVSVGTERYYFPEGRSGPVPVWTWLQYLSDFVHHLSPEDLLTCDVAAFHSRWWIGWTAESFHAEGKIADPVTFEAALWRKAVLTGVPELDAAASIDVNEVRSRWQIPRDKPVVVLLPFPQGVGKAAFWPRHIFNQPSRARQLRDVLLRGRFEYLPDIVHGWNDANVVAAIRTFCDRHDAFLLVKSRPKTPIPGYLASVADLALYDESHYPATILDALSCASLCISFYSSAVIEAVALGVPHLCVAFDMVNYFDVDEVAKARALRLFNRQAGGLYQFDGAALTMGVREAISTLPSMRLSDFAFNPGARKAYVEKFSGSDDGRASTRLLDAIASAVARRAVGRTAQPGSPGEKSELIGHQ